MFGIRLPLTIAFLLAALLSLVNVSAYRQASVTEGMSIQVYSTGSAALALAAGTGNAANQVSTTNGILQIDYRKGFGAANHSFQELRGGGTIPADLFKMLQVFTITNNGATCQDVAVYVSGSSVPSLSGIYGRLTGGATPGTQLATAGGAQNGAAIVKLQPSPTNNQMVLDFWWQSTGSVGTNGTFAIQVSSTKSASCP